MDYFNTKGCPRLAMVQLCSQCGARHLEFEWRCSILSMIYHTHSVRGGRHYKKYLLSVKCAMQYLGKPYIVKHYVLWKYHHRGGADDERLRCDLDQLIINIRNRRRRHIVRTLGRGLRIIDMLEQHIPVELGMLVVSY